MLPTDMPMPQGLPEDARELFEIWAPVTSRWSGWAKPVLFTYAPPATSIALPAWSWVGAPPLGSGRTAIVVDLPGNEGLACALALAARGFRPVPLYNNTQGEGAEVIALDPFVSGIRAAAATLAAMHIPDDAPPAFLLDSNRGSGGPTPGMFDNRWAVFAQDFPSGRALLSSGIERVVVMRREGAIRVDLVSVLRLWRREGVPSERFDVATGTQSELTQDISLLAVFSGHISAIMHGFRQNATGGFGARVPLPSAGGGGGFG